MLESAADRLALLQAAGERIEVDDLEVWAIFDDENSPIDADGILIPSTAPQITCRSSDVADVNQDSTVLVRGTYYRPTDPRPELDGAMVVWRLRQL